jgi:uncharacterized protein YbjT (DUF2867 family)
MPVMALSGIADMKITVLGGHGLVGARLVSTLRHRGHEVIAASRRSGVDALTGEGLANAVAGAHVVVNVMNSPSFDGDAVMDFFRTSSRNLHAAEVAAHVRHHIALSIVGTDRLQHGNYFRAKALQEELIQASPVPHTILRSTQFFEFLPRIAEPGDDGRVMRVPPVLTQPIAVQEVAAALADLTTQAPRNGMLEHAGPECFQLDELVRRVLHANQDSREVIADVHARYFGATLERDTLLPDEGAIVGVSRFSDWLSQSIELGLFHLPLSGGITPARQSALST